MEPGGAIFESAHGLASETEASCIGDAQPPLRVEAFSGDKVPHYFLTCCAGDDDRWVRLVLGSDSATRAVERECCSAADDAHILRNWCI